MLTDLATAARKSGLRVIELDGWRTNDSAGSPPGHGVLAHHTGGYDEIGDTTSDLAYARWLGFIGRPDLDPPLCNLALSAEGVVYVTAAGNANHAGQARASGPMPAATDGNALYIGIEAMNSGSQGWNSKGLDADGNEITQYEAYVRLCAALCKHYRWPASHVRGHRETSVTGKVDPGGIDLDKFRADVAREMNREEDDMPNYTDWPRADKEALANDVANEVLRRKVKVLNVEKEPIELTVKQVLARLANSAVVIRDEVKGNDEMLADIISTLDEMNEGG